MVNGGWSAGEDAAQARVGVSWPAATGFAPGAIAAPLRPGGGPLATWSIAREGHYTRASTVSDGRGLVLLCDVPQGSRLRFAVRATDGGSAPATRHVRGSNHCLIGVFDDRIEGRAILISAIDNLVKGASGQAIQNMNLMHALPETTGLEQAPLFP